MSDFIDFAIQTTVLRHSIFNCVLRSDQEFFEWNDLRTEIINETMRADGIVSQLEEHLICNRGMDMFKKTIKMLNKPMEDELDVYIQLYSKLDDNSSEKEEYEKYCVLLHLTFTDWMSYIREKHKIEDLVTLSIQSYDVEDDASLSEDAKSIQLPPIRYAAIHESSYIRRIISKMLVVLNSRYSNIIS